MTWLIFLILPPFLAYLFFVARIAGLFGASALFAYFQLAMAIGTFPLLKPSIPADRLQAFVIVATFLIYLGVNTGCTFFSTKYRRRDIAFTAIIVPTAPSRGLWIWIGISVAVCLAYYLSLGYNVFTLGIGNAFSGSSSHVSIATLRHNAYAGSQYLFPGYVNQFKNALLPSLSVVAAVALFHTRSRYRWVVSIALAVVSLIFLLGTGQRGAFVTFAIVVFVFVFYVNRAVFWRWMPWILLAGVVVFMLSTLALGRSQTELDAAGGLFGKLGVLLGQVAFRAFGSNQVASVAAFRYFYSLPSQHGADWFQSLLGILPGVRGSTIENQIYARLYGSDTGTAPPSIWGSAYYNFGLTGPLVLAAVMAVFCHWLTALGGRAKTQTTLETIGMAGVFTAVGTWVAGDPTYLLNVGGVVFALLWLIGARSRNPLPVWATFARRFGLPKLNIRHRVPRVDRSNGKADLRA